MKFYVLIFISLLLVGCSSINKSTNKANFSASASTSLEADVVVGEKITGSAKSTFLLGLIKLPGGPNKFSDGVFSSGGISLLPNPASELKSAAAYRAIESSGADLIINPQYVITVDNTVLFKTYRVDVTGYKGTIQGFK